MTAEETRAAEQRAIDAGTPVDTLMERAGAAAAEAIRRFAGSRPALVLCGPGNNGGDGYVIARRLREGGADVAIAALGPPATPAATGACRRWAGPVSALDACTPRALLVDALFGTGLKRGLDETAASALAALAAGADCRVAVDLPSGAATDGGEILSPIPGYELTVTFASKKPSHLLQPAARHMGRIVVADIGIEAAGEIREVERPHLRPPTAGDHKYDRGYLLIAAGDMPGAAALAASAAARSGAGYVRLLANTPVCGVPRAVVQGAADAETLLGDPRLGAVAIGPGLGRSQAAQSLLEACLAAAAPLVLDADALHLLAQPERLHERASTAILTPHEGEFVALFGHVPGNKIERARAAAARSGAILVYKGADTLVAAPDGRVALAPPAPAWLATAGTGDVLTGIVAAMRARGLEAFEAACAAVWLHKAAAEAAGPALIADDLLPELRRLVAACS